jgi:hypothetical protein
LFPARAFKQPAKRTTLKKYSLQGRLGLGIDLSGIAAVSGRHTVEV